MLVKYPPMSRKAPGKVPKNIARSTLPPAEVPKKKTLTKASPLDDLSELGAALPKVDKPPLTPKPSKEKTPRRSRRIAGLEPARPRSPSPILRRSPRVAALNGTPIRSTPARRSTRVAAMNSPVRRSARLSNQSTDSPK